MMLQLQFSSESQVSRGLTKQALRQKKIEDLDQCHLQVKLYSY